jgi:hypothetical protein
MLIFIFVYNLRLLRLCHRTCSTVNPSCSCPNEALGPATAYCCSSTATCRMAQAHSMSCSLAAATSAAVCFAASSIIRWLCGAPTLGTIPVSLCTSTRRRLAAPSWPAPLWRPLLRQSDSPLALAISWSWSFLFSPNSRYSSANCGYLCVAAACHMPTSPCRVQLRPVLCDGLASLLSGRGLLQHQCLLPCSLVVRCTIF